MKTFDIEVFNKNKNHLNEYNYILKDEIKVYQWLGGAEEYIEIVNSKNMYFETLNRYYLNGKLKSTVQRFPKSFLAGVLKEYDKQGILVKETDYDKPYRFTWEDILKWVDEHNISMSNDYLEIGRNVVEGNPVWSIIWEKEDKSGLKIVGFNGITGAIIQDDERGYPEE